MTNFQSCLSCRHDPADHGRYGCRLTAKGEPRTLRDPSYCPCTWSNLEAEQGHRHGEKVPA